MSQTLQASLLRTQVASVLAAAGSSQPEAEQVAGNLVLIELEALGGQALLDPVGCSALRAY